MKMLLLLFSVEHFIFCIPLFTLSFNISKRNFYLNEYDFALGRLNFTKILSVNFQLLLFILSRPSGGYKQLSSNLQRNENAPFALCNGAFYFLHSALHTELQHFKKEFLPEGI
jgi:hypothetical protein